MSSIARCLVVLLLSTAPSLACSCAHPDPRAIVAASAVVFDGVVLDQTRGADPAGREAQVIRVRVLRIVKGARPASGVLILYAPPGAGMCGVQYPADFRGRFGASRVGAGLWTNNCVHFGLNRDYFRNPR